MNSLPDFARLFEQSPDILLVLLTDAPRYTMVAATESRLAVTHTTREQTMGRGLFEIFPDNPDDPGATGTSNLRASLDRVCATGAADTMAVQKYDIRGPDGAFESRYWSPKNLPVLSDAGEVIYILHRVEDVTDLVRASEAGDALRDRTRAMEHEVVLRSRELDLANRELRDANTKLGELDAAKTLFFSNISHEFRTPLTLMLGPLADGLADTTAPLAPAQRARWQLAHDNALRLLKLVNALLDFSRMEAGRLTAAFAPTDIAAVTAELAAMFTSAVDRAGLRLVIDCPAVSVPIWIDVDMWEKIVPNLVSNAFKFTLKGEIAVRLREHDDHVIVEVSDTGAGIPADALPRLFERFHRVPGTVGRTQEGSGIGLSLVRELVERHGGRIEVDSVVDRGTTFRVVMRKGFAHLPADSVRHEAVTRTLGPGAFAHAAEAAHWSDAEEREERAAESPAPRGAAEARVLVVDDNADLRNYIRGLLANTCDIRVAHDGVEALEMIRKETPDIVLSDVMMPRLDGYGLVNALRSDPTTALMPVILLSARAGEEAAIEGLGSGADDYLMKPFSARELLARVRTHVALARARRSWIAELERINAELDAFSYSVSHDLRAPLRAIDGFSGVLEEDYAAVLDDEGKDYLARIRQSTVRMGTLIDAMLSFARVQRAELQRAPVDISALASVVVGDLRSAHPERDVVVDVADGIVAPGDRALIAVVLDNLIGNAWKFTSRREHARIEVGRHDGDGTTFFVRDNGAGFDMASASRLFAPFERLHHQGEYAGTGIGLATVQRIVTRHGGRIWAESAVDAGATFFVSLPVVTGIP